MSEFPYFVTSHPLTSKTSNVQPSKFRSFTIYHSNGRQIGSAEITIVVAVYDKINLYVAVNREKRNVLG